MIEHYLGVGRQSQMTPQIEQGRLQVGFGELHLPPRGTGIQSHHRDIGGRRRTGGQLTFEDRQQLPVVVGVGSREVSQALLIDRREVQPLSLRDVEQLRLQKIPTDTVQGGPRRLFAMLLLMSQLNLLHYENVVGRRCRSTDASILIRRRLHLHPRIERVGLGHSQRRRADTLGLPQRDQVRVLNEGRFNRLPDRQTHQLDSGID